MADKEPTPKPDKPTEANPFIPALFRSFQRLQELKEQERRITIEKAQLKQSVDALMPLAFPDFNPSPNIASMTLADAIRLVIKSIGRPVSMKETRGKLQDLEFDLSKYENPLASIHTAVARMVESEELVWIDNDGKKKISAGPTLKPIPVPEMDAATMLGLLGENTAGEE